MTFQRITKKSKRRVGIVGKKFWTHLTGDEHFYQDLIGVAGDVAERFDASKHVEELIERIAKEL